VEELVKHARALLLLQIQLAQATMEQVGAPPLKLELLLADAGFGHREISVLLSKSQMAVAKAISRGRGARQKTAIPELSGQVEE
jgi:hypothetical protein